MEKTDGIYDLLVYNNSLLNNLYNNNDIILGNQNEGSLPKTNNFIIFYIIGTDNDYVPNIKFLPDLNKYLITNNERLAVQVDCYGNNALKYINALQTILSCFTANDFFKKNAIKLATFKNEPIQNLTQVLDNKKYTTRYTIRFELFSNTEMLIDQDYFDYDDFIVNFKTTYIQ